MEDEDELPAPPVIGGAEGAPDEEHEAHGAGYLYLPDLSSVTGWSGHRVPTGDPPKPERPPAGFRWR